MLRILLSVVPIIGVLMLTSADAQVATPAHITDLGPLEGVGLVCNSEGPVGTNGSLAFGC